MEPSSQASTMQAQFIKESDPVPTQNSEKENKIENHNRPSQLETDTTIDAPLNEETEDNESNDYSLYLGWLYLILGLHAFILALSIYYTNAAGIIDGFIGSLASIMMVISIKGRKARRAKWAKFIFLAETPAIIFMIISYNESLDLTYLDQEEDSINLEETTTPFIDLGKAAIIILIHLVFNVYAAHRTEKVFSNRENTIKESLCSDSISNHI